MLPMKNRGTRGSRVPGKLTPVTDLLLDGVSPRRFPAFDGLWSGERFGDGPDQHYFVVATAVADGSSVFKERPLRFPNCW